MVVAVTVVGWVVVGSAADWEEAVMAVGREVGLVGEVMEAVAAAATAVVG